jgi:hypothetical protein
VVALFVEATACFHLGIPYHGMPSMSLDVFVNCFDSLTPCLAMFSDPYLNTDAGTMSPFEHGEVFVLDDGGEVNSLNKLFSSQVFLEHPFSVNSMVTSMINMLSAKMINYFFFMLKVDLDLGNYERFLDVKLTRDNNITTGKIYQVMNVSRMTLSL